MTRAATTGPTPWISVSDVSAALTATVMRALMRGELAVETANIAEQVLRLVVCVRR